MVGFDLFDPFGEGVEAGLEGARLSKGRDRIVRQQLIVARKTDGSDPPRSF